MQKCFFENMKNLATALALVVFVNTKYPHVRACTTARTTYLAQCLTIYTVYLTV